MNDYDTNVKNHQTLSKLKKAKDVFLMNDNIKSQFSKLTERLYRFIIKINPHLFSEEEKKTTESTTEQTTEATTENTTETTEKVSITIERGATSYTVCQKLQELGIVKDAAEYDNYLIENGYASRIRVGTHELTKGMDYHAIAEAISDPL